VIDRQSSQEVSTADSQDVRIEHGEQAGWLLISSGNRSACDFAICLIPSPNKSHSRSDMK